MKSAVTQGHTVLLKRYKKELDQLFRGLITLKAIYRINLPKRFFLMAELITRERKGNIPSQ